MSKPTSEVINPTFNAGQDNVHFTAWFEIHNGMYLFWTTTLHRDSGIFIVDVFTSTVINHTDSQIIDKGESALLIIALICRG